MTLPGSPAHVLLPAGLPGQGTPALPQLIRRDQLAAVRQSVGHAIPVNVILGLASLLVAYHAGLGRTGLVWFSFSLLANLARLAVCVVPCHGLTMRAGMAPGEALVAARSVDRRLRLFWLGALMSGVVWAFLPLLCAGCTSPQTMFYLAVTCGITAGAVTHGIAFVQVPACFIAPPLLSTAGCLLAAGGFDRSVLAGTVLLYLFGLIRGARVTEAGFRETSRLTNEATALARSREVAHAKASALADEMRRRAMHDDLSGLLNRAGFVQLVEDRLGGPHDGAVLMLLDLDGFKSVNDVYGHKMGDMVLAEVAGRLQRALPSDTLAARIGGDEFALFYEPGASGIGADVLAARLIGLVTEPFQSFDAGRLGMSVGLCHVGHDSLTQLLSFADEALYAAKRAGRNRLRFFDARLRTRLEVRRDSERDLAQALAEGVVETWFQPIFAADGRQISGLEALARWHHPVHGWISPVDLVTAAAMSGQTEALVCHMLARVCAEIGWLRAEGLGHVRVSMNVSPREMAQVAVDAIVLEALARHGLPPAMLEIEITEETALDIEAVQAKLLALTEAGVHVALDDFGVGYSSLALLRQLRAGRVKMDRSIVTALAEAPDKRSMVEAVLGLGRSLGLEVVAEGVETAADLAALQAMGCPLLQGFHLGRPMPAAAIRDLLQGAPREA